MSKALLVDTDVMVDFLRGREHAVKFIRDHANEIELSCITVAELYAGVRGKEERKILDDLVCAVPVHPVTPEIAKNGGLFRRDYMKSYNVGLADALIAATAMAASVGLRTLNVRHFPMLSDVEVPYTRD